MRGRFFNRGAASAGAAHAPHASGAPQFGLANANGRPTHPSNFMHTLHATASQAQGKHSRKATPTCLV